MKEVNILNLKEAANKILFTMSEDEYKTLLKDFENVFAQMKLIALDKSIDDYEPLIYPFPIEAELREDIASTPSKREEILSNVKNVVGGQIKLEKK